MSIELSDMKYWKRMGYHDGMLYCSMISIEGKNDWRMISDWEEFKSLREARVKASDDNTYYTGWVVEDGFRNGIKKGDFMVIPVRDY